MSNNHEHLVQTGHLQLIFRLTIHTRFLTLINFRVTMTMTLYEAESSHSYRMSRDRREENANGNNHVNNNNNNNKLQQLNNRHRPPERTLDHEYVDHW